MEHVQEIKINYDYLVLLIAKMADEINKGQVKEAAKTMDDISCELSKMDNEKQMLRMKRFIR